jgi:DNA polymerase III subunit epsilon
MGTRPRVATEPIPALASLAPDVIAAFDAELACVDLETTGGNAGYHRIIEVGIIQVDRDGTTREWSTLVNPGRSIPAQISAFTGIDDEMVRNAPSFAELAPEILGRLKGRLFVAHNARFDYGFLRAEFRRIDVNWSARALCTVRLSRRMHPEHRAHNLDALIERHRLNCQNRHRALADAHAVLELLAAFGREPDGQRLSSALARLQDAPAIPAQLSPDLAQELPDAPGVYRFLGAGDALLYVGMSRSLRSRVLAHFSRSTRAGLDARLATQVQRVTWTETVGELGAQLLEARAVRDEAPVYNRRLRAARALWSVSLRAVPGRPSAVEIAPLDAIAAQPDGSLYGLYRGRDEARRALVAIARAHQLCLKSMGLEAAPGSCCAYQLGRCRGACVDLESPALHDTRLKLALAATRLRPWPFAGRIALVESDWQGNRALHVFSHWRHLGTVTEQDEMAELVDAGAGFDLDMYRLIGRWLQRGRGVSLLEIDRC